METKGKRGWRLLENPKKVLIVLDAEHIAAIDSYTQRCKIRSRSAAIRELIEGLEDYRRALE